MSGVGEIVGIIACVASIISAYQDGGRIIEKIKKKRAEKRGMLPPRLLEESIEQAPDEIEREKSRGIQRFGKAFEDGDHIAIIALQRITIEIQSSLLEQLRDAAYDDEVTDFMSLVDAADTGRDRTISTLLDLRQRLLQASAVNDMSNLSIGKRSSTLPSQSSVTSQPRDQGPDHRQVMKHRRTLTPETSSSGYVSNADDTTSGAEDILKKKSRNKSMFGFLGHHRKHSNEQVPKRDDELSRQTSAPTSNAAFLPPKHCDVREDATSDRSGSTAKALSTEDATSVRSGSTAAPKFTYEEGEDNPFEIWGARKPVERRDTQIAPDSMVSMSRQSTWNSVAPSTASNSTMTRTVSGGTTSHPAPAGHGHSTASIAVPHPSAENNYLGFCKGAWKLQTGDRKGLNKCKDYMYSAQAGVFYLACSASKCAFAGHYNPNIIWDKVWVDKARGIKFRWPFLAKSHVQQKTVKGDQYSYQCLFCVYLGNSTPVMNGMDLYLEHISTEHRGHAISDVVLYKCGAINDREAEDSEDFDMNLFPLSAEEWTKRKDSNVLADDLMAPDSLLKRSDTIAKDSMFSNEPWNEGLSDFSYGGTNEFDYTSNYDRDFRAAELEG